MGANAQTAVPTFTASQVLTAAQMNQSARTGVPVFATTTTRNDAFGGTGEKTLAEGQLCYVEGTGLQSYNGTAWVTWGTAPSGGLTLISATTIGTAVSSVTVTGAFSSTYDNYLVTVTGGVCSVDSYLKLTLGSTTANYYYGVSGVSFAGVQSNSNGNNVAFMFAGTCDTSGINGQITIMRPEKTDETNFYVNIASPRTTGGVAYAGGGLLSDSTSYTAFTLTPNAGTLTGGNIRVYGFQNS